MVFGLKDNYISQDDKQSTTSDMRIMPAVLCLFLVAFMQICSLTQM